MKKNFREKEFLFKVEELKSQFSETNIKFTNVAKQYELNKWAHTRFICSNCIFEQLSEKIKTNIFTIYDQKLKTLQEQFDILLNRIERLYVQSIQNPKIKYLNSDVLNPKVSKLNQILKFHQRELRWYEEYANFFAKHCLDGFYVCIHQNKTLNQSWNFNFVFNVNIHPYIVNYIVSHFEAFMKIQINYHMVKNFIQENLQVIWNELENPIYMSYLSLAFIEIQKCIKYRLVIENKRLIAFDNILETSENQFFTLVLPDISCLEYIDERFKFKDLSSNQEIFIFFDTSKKFEILKLFFDQNLAHIIFQFC